MFGFVIRKWFFDLWDNVLPLILVNLGSVLLLTIPAITPSVARFAGPAGAIVVSVIGLGVAFVYFGAASGFARDVSNYTSLGWSAFWQPLKANIGPALLIGTLVTAHIILAAVALPFYQSLGNLFGVAALAVLFWISVLWWLVALWYLPVVDRLERRPLAALRKAAIIMFDNTGFALFVAIGALVIVVMSLFTALLVPGVGGLMLWIHVALKLRLYKYDYLEEHPEADRRRIPWDALLVDDRERVGKRTLRGMIFPWKE